MPSTFRRTGLATALALGLACPLALGASAAPADDPADGHGELVRIKRIEPGANARLVKAVPTVRAAASSDLTPATATSRLNSWRGQYGVTQVTYSSQDQAALNAHAKYVKLNWDTDEDLSTEEQGKPGYTEDGAAIAPYAFGTESATLSGALNAWISDPYTRDTQLLEQTVRSVAFGSYGSVRLFVVAATGDSPTGYPRSWPAGNNHTLLRNGANWLDEAYSCSGAGQPVSAQWDYMTFGQATATGGKLQMDGVTQPTCIVAPSANNAAGAAMVPNAALQPGRHYTGQLTATLAKLAGGSQAVVRNFEFTTAAPATSVAGDQSGDRVADIFAVNKAGDLYVYKGRSNGSVGHGWKVGHGWGGFNWISLAGDVNRDGRSDLIGRRSDGTLWLYQSLGMGSFANAKRVGTGWSGLSALTVVGDMNNDGVRDLVARTKSGDLLRYNLGTSVTGGTKIGHGWNGMTHLVGPGSMNGDRFDDIMAVRSDGKLFLYTSGAKSQITSTRQVGHGWQGWSALFIVGDVNGDGRLDMMGRSAAGELYSYRNNGTMWAPAVRAGSGWGNMKLLA